MFSEVPAYLHLEPEILRQIAETAGRAADHDPRSSLVAAVIDTLGLDAVTTPFLWHISASEEWEESGRRRYPPFLALLAVLVLAAQEMVADNDYASHNYYSRLENLLGIDDALWRRVRHHFPETVELWLALNDWLEEWEGERGFPTAAVLDRRVYVSYPLSQAIVRAADRARLREAFLEYGLTPGRRLAPAEMRRYLNDWLSHFGGGSRLARLWSSSDAQNRIVEIACGELAAWTGAPTQSVDAHGGSLSQRLRWAAELRDGPLPVLELYLTARADTETINGHYDVIEPSDLAGREAVVDCGSDLRLEPLDGCELASLEPWPSIGVASLLAGALRIARRNKPSTQLLHSPNSLIVLALDERDGWYREVARAQLLEPSMVLAYIDKAENVERHLRVYARPGFRKLDRPQIEGLPTGWVAFLDVVVALPTDEQDHAAVLAPLCPTPANTMALTGGLRLGPSTWHADAPPELSVSLETQLSFSLLATCRRKLSDDAIDIELGDHIGQAALPMSGRGMEPADYDIRANSRGARSYLLAHASLRIRTADFPRPAASDRLERHGHRLDLPQGLLSASAPEAEGPMAEGALIINPPTNLLPPPRLEFPAQPLTAAIERTIAFRARPSRLDESRYAQSCATRGYHHWLCEPGFPGESTRTLKRMQCSGCQREEWTVNRGRRQSHRAQLRPTAGRRVDTLQIAPIVRRSSPVRSVLDTLLDALSYVGSGSWPMLKQMGQALGDDPVLAWKAARVLSALGHIDVSLDLRTYRLARWQISPSVLVETADGSWVLAGARSGRLMDDLDLALDGAAVFEEDQDAPTVIRTPAMPEAEALALAGCLTSPLGGQVHVSPRFAERTSAALQSLGTLLPSLEVARMPSRGLELFDLATGRWQPAGDLPRAGAYRFELNGRLYGFASLEAARQGRMRVVDVLAAKYLAAASGRVSLAGYDPQSGTLSTPLGADLPGILHRVATLSSGSAPRTHADSGIVTYRGVTSSVAAHLQRCLGITGSTRGT